MLSPKEKPESVTTIKTDIHMIFIPLKVKVFCLTSHTTVTPISTNNNYTTDGRKNKIYPVVWGEMLEISKDFRLGDINLKS